MDLITFLQAAFLGFVEGITEFLPISSTGHLILTVDLLGFKGPEGAIFEVVIQLGAILAVCWLYREKLFGVMRHFFDDASQRRFVWLVSLSFAPSVVIGLLAHDFIKQVLFSPKVVAVSLVVGGIAILIIERIKPEPRHDNIDRFSYKLAFFIGCAQILAMIPGVSRSGATIMGALMLGASRKAAAEFSFFLAIPTMFGASAYDLYKNAEHLNGDSLSIIAVGFVSSFIFGVLAIKWLIAYLQRHDFTYFAYYRIAIGSLMLALLF